MFTDLEKQSKKWLEPQTAKAILLKSKNTVGPQSILQSYTDKNSLLLALRTNR